VFRMIDPPSVQERQCLLDREEQSLDVDGERLVEVLLADRPERGQHRDAGVGEQDVEAALLLLHPGIEPVEVREVGDIALHARDVLADLLDRFLEFRLPAAGDEDVGTLGDEPPRPLRGARASPMPLLPPVMTATFPCSFFAMGLLRCP
jgi:hypothetical protein